MKEKENHTLLGAIFILLAATSFALMGLFVKFLDARVSNEETVFARSFLSLVLVMPFLFVPKKISPKTAVFPSHLIRGLASLFAAYAMFYSVHHITLADAILLSNTMPLFVPFVMLFWKGEKFPPRLFIPILISFLGILLILRPGVDVFHPASLIALSAGLLMSVSSCGMRELGKTEPLPRILFYAGLIATCVSLIPLFWSNSLPNGQDFLLLVLVAICGFLYQFLIVLGYKKASPTKISPFIYFAVIVSGIFDWIFWHDIPHYLSFVGLILVCFGAVWCMKIEVGAGYKQ